MAHCLHHGKCPRCVGGGDGTFHLPRCVGARGILKYQNVKSLWMQLGAFATEADQCKRIEGAPHHQTLSEPMKPTIILCDPTSWCMVWDVFQLEGFNRATWGIKRDDAHARQAALNLSEFHEHRHRRVKGVYEDKTLKTLTSLNKGVRPFFLSDNSIWSFPSVSSPSDYSIWRSWRLFYPCDHSIWSISVHCPQILLSLRKNGI